MTTIDLSTTLAEVVDAQPSLARELERRGLDYCCGGGRTLADACAGKGLDVEATIAELRVAAVGAKAAEWTTMSPDALVAHIEATHHRYLWDEMPRLTALVDKIVSVHGERHPELREVAATYAHIRLDLEPHMLKEERVLFPMIRALASATDKPEFHCGTLQNPISVMMREHDLVGDLLERLHELTNGYTTPSDGCASYAACYAGFAELEADTHLHIHKENNVLFPMVVQLEAERTSVAG